MSEPTVPPAPGAGAPGPPSMPAPLDLPPPPIPTPTPPMAPVAGAERVAEIDAVRGFALLGILLMNIEWFNRPLQGLQLGLDPSLTGLDRIAGWLVMALVQGKFYTLFSMLFGMGFAIQLERARARGGRFGGFFARRLLVLAAIGAAHGFLLWPGDILFSYALCGFPLLLFFRRTPASRLPKWGIPLVLLPLLGFFLMMGALEMSRTMDPAGYAEIRADQQEAREEVEREYAEAAEEWAHASWSGLSTRRASDMANQMAFLPFFGFTLVGLFVLGAWFVRSGTIVRPAEHLGFYRRALVVGLAVGIPLALVAMESGFTAGFGEASWALVISASVMELANLALALAYLSGIVLLLQRPAWRERLRPLAVAGRMALTNYLLQSAIATTLFYGYGFGLFGSVPRAWQILLALAIFAVNLVFSTLWLRHFRFGPGEWIWRTLTYGKLQPLRR